MIDMVFTSSRASCHQPQYSTGSGDSKKMLASQAPYAQYSPYTPWTKWPSEWIDQQSQHALPTPAPDGTVPVAKRPRQAPRHPLKVLCASSTPSRVQGTIVAAPRPLAPPVRSVSWPANLQTSITAATAASTSTLNVPASVDTQHSAPAAHSEPLASIYNFGPAITHNVTAFPDPHLYEQPTPWMFTHSTVSNVSSHAVCSNNGRQQHPQTVRFDNTVDSESSSSSFSSPPSYPSQISVKQEQHQEETYSKKQVQGLLIDFDSWQDHEDQVYFNNPLTQPTPSDTSLYIEPTRSRKRKSSDIQHGVRRYKPFRCEYCDFAFDRKCNLTCHLKTHGVGTKVVECPQAGCGKRYGRQADANRHIRTVSRHTQQQWLITNSHEQYHNKTQHTCEACGKVFARSDILRR